MPSYSIVVLDKCTYNDTALLGHDSDVFGKIGTRHTLHDNTHSVATGDFLPENNSKFRIEGDGSYHQHTLK